MNMDNEKNQLLLILGTLGLIGMAVFIFLIVGGEFKFLFINFSASGIFGPIAWAVPVLMIVVQQIYIIPTFMKSYWEVFASTPPTSQEVYVPFLNEAAVYESLTVQKVVYGMWACVGGLVLITAVPILGYIGMSGSFVTSSSFYILLLSLILYVCICLIRGFSYLGVRKNIYDYHNKYFGVRGTSPYFWLYQLLYFVPLGRSISLLMDIQVMDKITKFNNVQDIDMELREE